jgi:hypothetical protein
VAGVSQHEIDIKQQQQIGKAFREIADLRGDVTKIETALIGIDGTNGLRGELRDFIQHMNLRMSSQDGMLKIITDNMVRYDQFQRAVETRLENYMKYERIATCHGKSELDKYLASIQRDNNEIKKARIALIGAVIVAVIGAGASVVAVFVK